MANDALRSAALAVALVLLASTARAEDAGCFVELDGRALIDGSCFADFKAGRVVSLSGTAARGGTVSFSLTSEARGRAGGLLNVTSGQLNSYDEVDSLRREGSCWVRPRFRACAWRAGEPRPRL